MKKQSNIARELAELRAEIRRLRERVEMLEARPPTFVPVPVGEPPPPKPWWERQPIIEQPTVTIDTPLPVTNTAPSLFIDGCLDRREGQVG